MRINGFYFVSHFLTRYGCAWKQKHYFNDGKSYKIWNWILCTLIPTCSLTSGRAFRPQECHFWSNIATGKHSFCWILRPFQRKFRHLWPQIEMSRPNQGWIGRAGTQRPRGRPWKSQVESLGMSLSLFHLQNVWILEWPGWHCSSSGSDPCTGRTALDWDRRTENLASNFAHRLSDAESWYVDLRRHFSGFPRHLLMTTRQIHQRF